MRVQRTLLLPALAALSLLVGSACSSDGSDASPTGARSTTTTDGATTTDPDGGSTTTEVDGGPTTSRASEPAQGADAYVAALEETLTAPALEGAVDAEQARCVAEGFVEAIGGDELVESGISPEDFALKTTTGGNEGLQIDEATANDMFDVYGQCDIDLQGLFETQSGADLSAEEQACIKDVLTDENLRTSFIIGVTGGDVDDDPTADLVKCFDVTEISPPASITVPG
ncbi:hypothetical protein BH10ACT1_BH10ACT1_10460 [soil metagenome]